MRTTTTPATREPWRACFAAVPEEHYELSCIEGRVPNDLVGTLFRNGASQFQWHGQPTRHWFDGDGMISSYAVADGAVTYRNRYVRTEGFVANAEGRRPARMRFGTPRQGWLRRVLRTSMENVANTSPVFHAGNLYACWETTLPYRIDPATLLTAPTEHDFDGALRGCSFSAHAKIDPVTGEMFNHGVRYGPGPTVDLYRFGADGALAARRRLTLDLNFLIHDFALTEEHVVLFEPSAYVALPAVALGLQAPGGSLHHDDQRRCRFRVFRRGDFSEVATLETDPGFSWHVINAFDVDGTTLCVDLVMYDHVTDLGSAAGFTQIDVESLPAPCAKRFYLHLDRGTVTRELLFAERQEFPTTHPSKTARAYRYYFATGGLLPRDPVIYRFDTQTRRSSCYVLPAGHLADEPIVAPVAGADDGEGYLLVPVFKPETRTNELLILDAGRLQGPPVARLALRGHVPPTFHGIFVPHMFTGPSLDGIEGAR